ncbi:MAG: HD-GYP domain-containing protein [Brevinema sp.]
MGKKLTISEISIGSRYTAPLLDKKQNLLLPAYHSIHPDYLKEWLQTGNYVLTEGAEVEDTSIFYEIELPGYIDKETRNLLNTYYKTVQLFKSSCTNIHQLTLNQIQKIIAPWISYALARENLSPFLKVCRYALFLLEDYFYIHSVDTMLISLGVYKQYYNKEIVTIELTKLATGALLCDIGMLLLPKNLTQTDQIYTEEQKKEIQKHTILGYSFLSTKLELPQEICQPALEHHERSDGSGYPYQYEGNKLHPNSIIISLADVFASQIHGRSFKEGKEPTEILKDFIQTMMPVFPEQYSSFISAFISYITIYPATSVLELNTKEVAIVIKTYPQYPTRPKILLLLDPNKNRYDSLLEIDLSDDNNQHISITGIYTRKMLESLNINNW